MLNPLVQNYLNRQNYQTEQTPVKQAPVYAPVYPKGLKPDTSRGHLVKENIFQKMGSIYKSYYDSAKDFYKAIKGQGTDYTVGRLNDSALRLGGLGIAAAISTTKPSLFGKSMEFVGFASWFAAMSIWPTAFIGMPVKMMYGFDVNQKYIDSYGRRKRFFEDPQYIPWDMMSDEKINKIGDKMKIPKNIENRREAIQDKMKQIAIQSNTLWMLTAGFATPLLASLTACALEKPVAMITDKFKKEEIDPKSIFKTSTAEELFDKKLLSGLKDEESKAVQEFVDKYNEIGKTIHPIFGSFKDSTIAKIWSSAKENKGVPERIYKALGFGEEFTERLAKQANSNQRVNMIVDHLIKTFSGSKNSARLDAAVKEIADSSYGAVTSVEAKSSAIKTMIEGLRNFTRTGGTIEQLFDRNPSALDQLVGISSKMSELINANGDRLESFTKNPGYSFFQFLRPLELIAEHKGDEKSLAENLRNLVNGFGIDNVINRMDHIKGIDQRNEEQVEGVLNLIFGNIKKAKNGAMPLSNRIASAIGDANIAGKISEYKHEGWWFFKNGVTASNTDSASRKIGKVFEEFLYDASKNLYNEKSYRMPFKKWFKTVGIAGAALVGLTLLAITQFGKKNKYNQDVYEFKGGSANVGA